MPSLHDRLLALLRSETDAALAFAHWSSGAQHRDGVCMGVMAAIRLLEPAAIAGDPSHFEAERYPYAIRHAISRLIDRQRETKPGSASFRFLAGQIGGLRLALLEIEGAG